MRSLPILVLFVGLLIACGEDEPAGIDASNFPTGVVRVKVLKDGALVANDRTVTLEELGVVLADAGTKKHKVWYYREEPESEPPPICKQVIDLIGKNKLPIRLSREPDYVDCFD